MNLFAYVWLFLAIILLVQGIRTSKKGMINTRAFILAAVAVGFVLLNVFIK